eukprot:11781926-Alexandrium_andersonii.AAC.1
MLRSHVRAGARRCFSFFHTASTGELEAPLTSLSGAAKAKETASSSAGPSRSLAGQKAGALVMDV